MYVVFLRHVERTVPKDHHDWHTDRSAVVYLRFCKGLLPSATSSATRDAGVSEEEAGGGQTAVELVHCRACVWCGFLRKKCSDYCLGC